MLTAWIELKGKIENFVGFVFCAGCSVSVAEQTFLWLWQAGTTLIAVHRLLLLHSTGSRVCGLQ